MKLGFVSAIFPELTLDEVLGFAAEAGFSSVEVMCWPPGKAERRYAGVSHLDATAPEPDAIRDLTRRHGVAISGLGYYPNPLAADRAEAEQAVAHLHRLIDVAAELQIGLVNTFVGRDPALSVEASWPGFLETWTPLIAHAEREGAGSGSRIARCCSRPTSGPAARTWRPPRTSGGGCSRRSPAPASG